MSRLPSVEARGEAGSQVSRLIIEVRLINEVLLGSVGSPGCRSSSWLPPTEPMRLTMPSSAPGALTASSTWALQRAMGATRSCRQAHSTGRACRPILLCCSARAEQCSSSEGLSRRSYLLLWFPLANSTILFSGQHQIGGAATESCLRCLSCCHTALSLPVSADGCLRHLSGLPAGPCRG